MKKEMVELSCTMQDPSMTPREAPNCAPPVIEQVVVLRSRDCRSAASIKSSDACRSSVKSWLAQPALFQKTLVYTLRFRPLARGGVSWSSDPGLYSSGWKLGLL